MALSLLGSDSLSGDVTAGAAAQAPQADLAGPVADMCVAVHSSVQEAAERMHQELRRRWVGALRPLQYLPPSGRLP